MLHEVPLLHQVPIQEQDQESQKLVLVEAVDPYSGVQSEEGQTYSQRSEYVPV